MAEVTVHRLGQMIQQVLAILSEHQDGLPAQEVIQLVEQKLPPTEFENSEYPNNPGVRRFGKMVRFSTIGPVKAGWMVKNKGTWLATEDGLAAWRKFSDPADLMKEANRLYKEWAKTQPKSGQPGEDAEESEQTAPPAVTLEDAADTARREIRDYLGAMPPYDFQELVAALLRSMGYHVSWVAPPGPDRGIDIVAYTDPLGASGPRMKVQVKRRADKVGVQEVRSFFAVLGNVDVGVFVCLGGFSPDAHAEARSQESRRISLLDADDLVDLWIEHYGEIPEESRQLLALKPVYYLAPS